MDALGVTKLPPSSREEHKISYFVQNDENSDEKGKRRHTQRRGDTFKKMLDLEVKEEGLVRDSVRTKYNDTSVEGLEERTPQEVSIFNFQPPNVLVC